MTNLMMPDWDPYSKIIELEGTVLLLTEQMEEMSGQHVNNAWLLEQTTKQIYDISEAVNRMAEVIVKLRQRITTLESTLL